MSSMNEEQKQRFLNEMLRSGESYQAAVWGIAAADAKTCTMFSTLPAGMAAANMYCYIGMSEENINLVLVSSSDPSRQFGKMRLPFARIESAAVKNSLIPGRRVIDLIVSGRVVRLQLTNSTVGTDLKDQKEGIRRIAERIRTEYGSK